MTYSDSTLKSFKKDFLIGIIRCLEHNISVLEERNDNQYKLLMKSHQYRWHDLRRNPSDLPDDFHTVFICVKGFEGKTLGVSIAMYNRPLKIWGTESFRYKDCQVVAWREIEPFEGEE